MIIGLNLFLELQIYLRFSGYIIRLIGATYEVCKASMIYINNSCVIIPSGYLDDKRFRDEEWWESEHVLDAT